MGQENQGNNSKFIRVWKQIDGDLIRKHLLYIDDLYGTCGNCKRLGLNYLKDKSCPQCGITFKYLATKLTNPAEIGKILSRIQKENLDLTLIERDDFEKSSARDAVKDLFKT
ncbi:hypothetical protein LPTSP4_29780 [Leptospira ryugenii]|uniref:Uncharacterized protein n=1 Tax=Leptospira ryugenii TaxID=1917863 RepID=A0A2P2E3J2_9LEPT|nr:hypothetical protein [Leptospira ryugenii]GBF51441.1 hypothetical protein LPTSP4_29780 [Leptospira ryugenii]